MVFSTTNLFKSINCPAGEQCKLTNCIYGHDLRPQAIRKETATPTPTTTKRESPIVTNDGEPDPKRPRLRYSRPADQQVVQPTRAHLYEEEKVNWDLKKASSKPMRRKSTSPLEDDPPEPVKSTTLGSISETGKTASASKSGQQATKVPVKKEDLNPRQVPNSPETHGKRTLLLRAIHTEMIRLNKSLGAKAGVDNWTPLILSEQELITLALDEEEQVARGSPKVYGNVIRNRILKYKKMHTPEWIDVVKATFRKGDPTPPGKPPPKPVDTGLTFGEEIQMLKTLVIPDQTALARFDYIPDPPSTEQAEEAARSSKLSANWEKCDRCDTRFQVFPDRNEEGHLTSRGPCKFHPLRLVTPTREKIDAYTGGKNRFHPCCMGEVGTHGCTTNTHHVFKTTSPARLAAVVPFIVTPENANPRRDHKGKTIHGVAFDCEMGYTVLGFELIRLTAIAWPSGSALLDILVRPVGTVLDLNSRFSGVHPETFAAAIPYADWIKNPPADSKPTTASSALPIADSPQAARSLLCAYLTPKTPLIGHAIENDLNVTRLCHPTVVDTAILYPSRGGLPFRNGLRNLAKQYLARDIQTGGERGHDSREDAVATGDLVRVKCKAAWEDYRRRGWQRVEGVLRAPKGWGGGDMVGAECLRRNLGVGRERAGRDGRGGRAAGRKEWTGVGLNDAEAPPVGRKQFWGYDGLDEVGEEAEEGGEKAELSVEFLEK